MEKVEKVKHAIEELSEDEFAQIRNWLIERDWKKWDEQIEKDSEGGRLDFLLKEAQEEKAKGKLKAL